jgi:hypothetical protein
MAQSAHVSYAAQHTATPGLNFKREEVDLTARAHADHCEGTGIRSIFNGIAMKSVGRLTICRAKIRLINTSENDGSL